MRIHFILPGLHRVHRGAEVAFEAIASGISNLGLDEVTLFGSGPPNTDRPYRFQQSGMVPRERFERLPRIPPFRSEYICEEATWTANYLRRYRPSEADVTITCSYPFVNWMLTRWPLIGRRPAHVFVTQNGDWPAYSDKAEYNFFKCDGLVCTNPLYFERNRERWPSALIPNGVDPGRFAPGPGARARFNLPTEAPVVLMVSALVESKRVLEGMRAIAQIPGLHLVVAGDGPLRNEFDDLGATLMPGRFQRMTIPLDLMPDLYRSADVMLHPTFHESFGNVYAEAMAVGIPVVAHDYSVTRWIFGDHYSGLVDAADLSAIAKSVTHAIEQGPLEASRLAPGAAERFSWTTIAKLYRDFLAEIHERNRKTKL
ncbi:glycosyltransferase family 4 protein [Sphingomonas glaciei]|uniref:Glycosyltransferase family 4 protein n=1 Tax=Sphingomonas glaciei TaxID=2938948 RepID=A0ABY5MR23_9SPHN|nr:glycosyltransferase family 4 protein [Sphingomonas glaciei]UUR06940.1 glycosyltransferase family 4 protein [Sphingomonas glaciei]